MAGAGVGGLWTDHVLPRLIDVVLSGPPTAGWRAKATSGTAGVVLELGFGAGNNLPFYPEAVTDVYAVEPADVAWQSSAERRRSFGRPVTRIGLDGARVDLPDASVDAVVSTWTMCTIPELAGALAEAGRVLRPGGRLHLVEHSLAPEEDVARWQRRIQPWWGPVAGGCHVDRDIAAYLRSAGFATDELGARYAVGARIGRPWSFFVSGSAAYSPGQPGSAA